MKYCEKCDEIVNDDAKVCPCCGGELGKIVGLSSNQEGEPKKKELKDEATSDGGAQKSKGSNKFAAIRENVLVVLFCVVVGALLIWYLMPDPDANKCEACGRTFTNSEDISSIRMTDMCVPCYEDYKFTKELREELKKYEERNS